MDNIQKNKLLFMAATSALFVGLGSFAPWVKVAFASANGLDGGGDGFLTLGISVAALSSVYLYWAKSWRKTAILITLLGVCAAALGGYEMHHIRAALDSDPEYASMGTIGWGLWLVLISGIWLAIDGLLMLKRNR